MGAVAVMVDAEAEDLYCRLFVEEADEAVVRRVLGTALGAELRAGGLFTVDGIDIAVGRNGYRVDTPAPGEPEYLDWPTSVELDGDSGGSLDDLNRTVSTVVTALRGAGIGVVGGDPDEG